MGTLRPKVQQFQHQSYLRLRNIVRPIGLMRGQMAYTRFIILGRARSGSNFLRGLLNSHPQVVTFGELFHNPAELSWGLWGYPENRYLLHLMQQDPIRFLESQIFTGQPKRIAAVGFKIFYYHAHSAAWQPIWSYLTARHDIRVLHIKRSNILRAHLSLKQAWLTNKWVKKDGRPEEAPTVSLDYDECLHDFEETRQWEQEYARLFAEHPSLDVVYEELAADFHPAMQRVLAFLNLAPLSLAPRTYRQSSQPLAEAIANYDDLRSRFAGTPWSAFFDE